MNEARQVLYKGVKEDMIDGLGRIFKGIGIAIVALFKVLHSILKVILNPKFNEWSENNLIGIINTFFTVVLFVIVSIAVFSCSKALLDTFKPPVIIGWQIRYTGNSDRWYVRRITKYQPYEQSNFVNTIEEAIVCLEKWKAAEDKANGIKTVLLPQDTTVSLP